MYLCTQFAASVMGLFGCRTLRNIRIVPLLTKDEALNNLTEAVFAMIDPENVGRVLEDLEKAFHRHYYQCYLAHELPHDDRINTEEYLNEILEDFFCYPGIEQTRGNIKEYFERHFNLHVENELEQQQSEVENSDAENSEVASIDTTVLVPMRA